MARTCSNAPHDQDLYATLAWCQAALSWVGMSLWGMLYMWGAGPGCGLGSVHMCSAFSGTLGTMHRPCLQALARTASTHH
eukprot:10248620-Alexandrium_andersonii.AAC.1